MIYPICIIVPISDVYAAEPRHLVIDAEPRLLFWEKKQALAEVGL